jgi:ParB-like chromosome segregation protein Spo0J
VTIAGYPTTVRLLACHELRRLPLHQYAAIFPALSLSERNDLRVLIRAGYDPAEPIVIWAETGEIVDGRSRRDACGDLGINDVPCAFVHFPDDEAVRRYVIQANLARRHLGQEARRTLGAQLVNGHGYKVRDAAKLAGVSAATVSRAARAARGAAVANETPNGSRARLTKADPRVVSVRRALGVLGRMADEPIPSEVEAALSDDERAMLVAVLDALTGRLAAG